MVKVQEAKVIVLGYMPIFTYDEYLLHMKQRIY
jgi:hypothetical protein